MNTNFESINNLLHIKIEEIKTSNCSTKQMYIQVAKILFLQFQEMPTANRLYSLIKKGSMTTVVEAMKVFWQDIQKQLEIKIELPNIPPTLHTKIIEQIDNIWIQAMKEASSLFDEEKEKFTLKLQEYEEQIITIRQEVNLQNIKYEQIYEKYNLQNIDLENINKLNISLVTEKEDLFNNIDEITIKNKQQIDAFEQKIANLHITYNQQVQNLQQDIKMWQQKLDNERTQFKSMEKDLNNHNKLLQEKLTKLIEDLSSQKHENLTHINQLNILQNEYKKLNENFNLYELKSKDKHQYSFNKEKNNLKPKSINIHIKKRLKK